VSQAATRCSFCGLLRPGGVAGPTPDVYICKECIRLTHEMIQETRAPGDEAGPDAG
jgi:ribosomal protein S14